MREACRHLHLQIERHVILHRLLIMFVYSQKVDSKVSCRHIEQRLSASHSMDHRTESDGLITKTAKAKLQERERLNRLQQSTAPPNSNNKRPLSLIPAQSTSPTNPNSRSLPSNHRTTTTTASSSLQNAVASGSGSHHFKRDDPSVPLRNMIGNYVEYDLATLKNSK